MKMSAQLHIFDRIAKQVRSMDWRRPSVCPSVGLYGVNNLRLEIAFSLVSLKPLMIHKSNLVSLLTWISSSQPIQNLVTLTLTSRVSKHILILTLPCSLYTINHNYALLDWFVGIDEFFQTHTKFCVLDLNFALQWTLILTLDCDLHSKNSSFWHSPRKFYPEHQCFTNTSCSVDSIEDVKKDVEKFEKLKQKEFLEQYLEKCIQKDRLEQILEKVKGESLDLVLSLSRVLINERDIYLANSLKYAAEPTQCEMAPGGKCLISQSCVNQWTGYIPR